MYQIKRRDYEKFACCWDKKDDVRLVTKRNGRWGARKVVARMQICNLLGFEAKQILFNAMNLDK